MYCIQTYITTETQISIQNDNNKHSFQTLASNNSEYIVFKTLAPWLEKVMDSLGAHDLVYNETEKIFLEPRYLQIGQL